MTSEKTSTTAPVFDTLLGQPRVRNYLSMAVEKNQYPHALLFIGPPGSLKGEASYAFAAAVFCDADGCAACDSCIRVAHKTHPDVHVYRPEGATYLVEQIREIVHDTALAPIRAKSKIYILERADLLGDGAGNALLKTLEEPPPGVIFILQGRSESTMLPTILSRCQVVPFRRTPPSEAISLLVSETGASTEDVRAALAASGGVVTIAKEMLLSGAQWQRRAETLSTLSRLETMDDLDVLQAAKEMLLQAKVGLDQLAKEHALKQKEGGDFLSKGALKKLEQQQKRELSARERKGLEVLFAIIESYFHDCALYTEGLGDLVVNQDVAVSCASAARALTSADVMSIHNSIDTARARISYNTSSQLTLESLLFTIREVLRCSQ